MYKITPIIAILAIAGLAAFALSKGIDGILLAAVFAVIGGLAGYVTPHKKPPDKPEAS